MPLAAQMMVRGCSCLSCVVAAAKVWQDSRMDLPVMLGCTHSRASALIRACRKSHCTRAGFSPEIKLKIVRNEECHLHECGESVGMTEVAMMQRVCSVVSKNRGKCTGVKLYHKTPTLK